MTDAAPETPGSNPPVTPNHDAHVQADLHEIGRMVAELHEQFKKWEPHLARLFDNPAARWRARHAQKESQT